MQVSQKSNFGLSYVLRSLGRSQANEGQTANALEGLNPLVTYGSGGIVR